MPAQHVEPCTVVNSWTHLYQGYFITYVNWCWLLNIQHTHNLGDRAFAAAGPRFWNTLPMHIHRPHSTLTSIFISFYWKLKTNFVWDTSTYWLCSWMLCINSLTYLPNNGDGAGNTTDENSSPVFKCFYVLTIVIHLCSFCNRCSINSQMMIMNPNALLAVSNSISIKTLLQQNPPVLNRRCWLMQVALYNGCKTAAAAAVDRSTCVSKHPQLRTGILCLIFASVSFYPRIWRYTNFYLYFCCRVLLLLYPCWQKLVHSD